MRVSCIVLSHRIPPRFSVLGRRDAQWSAVTCNSLIRACAKGSDLATVFGVVWKSRVSACSRRSPSTRTGELGGGGIVGSGHDQARFVQKANKVCWAVTWTGYVAVERQPVRMVVFALSLSGRRQHCSVSRKCNQRTTNTMTGRMRHKG